MKLFYSVAFGLCVFAITRVLAYLLNLDGRAKLFTAFLKNLPIESVLTATWLIAGIMGLVALITTLIFDPWTLIADYMSPRPDIGSMTLAPDQAFHLNISRDHQTASAELYVDLINQNDRLVSYNAELHATVNGKDLDAPIRFSGYAAAHGPTRLIVRMRDVPITEHPEAFMRYDVTYYFKQGARARHTVKGIHWRMETLSIPTPGASEKIRISTNFYDELEE